MADEKEKPSLRPHQESAMRWLKGKLLNSSPDNSMMVVTMPPKDAVPGTAGLGSFPNRERLVINEASIKSIEWLTRQGQETSRLLRVIPSDGKGPAIRHYFPNDPFAMSYEEVVQARREFYERSAEESKMRREYIVAYDEQVDLAIDKESFVLHGGRQNGRNTMARIVNRLKAMTADPTVNITDIMDYLHERGFYPKSCTETSATTAGAEPVTFSCTFDSENYYAYAADKMMASTAEKKTGYHQTLNQLGFTDEQIEETFNELAPTKENEMSLKGTLTTLPNMTRYVQTLAKIKDLHNKGNEENLFAYLSEMKDILGDEALFHRAMTYATSLAISDSQKAVEQTAQTNQGSSMVLATKHHGNDAVLPVNFFHSTDDRKLQDAMNKGLYPAASWAARARRMMYINSQLEPFHPHLQRAMRYTLRELGGEFNDKPKQYDGLFYNIMACTRGVYQFLSPKFLEWTGVRDESPDIVMMDELHRDVSMALNRCLAYDNKSDCAFIVDGSGNTPSMISKYMSDALYQEQMAVMFPETPPPANFKIIDSYAEMPRMEERPNHSSIWGRLSEASRMALLNINWPVMQFAAHQVLEEIIDKDISNGLFHDTWHKDGDPGCMLVFTGVRDQNCNPIPQATYDRIATALNVCLQDLAGGHWEGLLFGEENVHKIASQKTARHTEKQMAWLYPTDSRYKGLSQMNNQRMDDPLDDAGPWRNLDEEAFVRRATGALPIITARAVQYAFRELMNTQITIGLFHNVVRGQAALYFTGVHVNERDHITQDRYNEVCDILNKCLDYAAPAGKWKGVKFDIGQDVYRIAANIARPKILEQLNKIDPDATVRYSNEFPLIPEQSNTATAVAGHDYVNEWTAKEIPADAGITDADRGFQDKAMAEYLDRLQSAPVFSATVGVGGLQSDNYWINPTARWCEEWTGYPKDLFGLIHHIKADKPIKDSDGGLLYQAYLPESLSHWLSQVTRKNVDFPKLPGEDDKTYEHRRKTVVEMVCSQLEMNYRQFIDGEKPADSIYFNYAVIPGVRLKGEDSMQFLERHKQLTVGHTWNIKVEFTRTLPDEQANKLIGIGVNQGIQAIGVNPIWNANMEDWQK